MPETAQLGTYNELVDFYISTKKEKKPKKPKTPNMNINDHKLNIVFACCWWSPGSS